MGNRDSSPQLCKFIDTNSYLLLGLSIQSTSRLIKKHYLALSK